MVNIHIEFIMRFFSNYLKRTITVKDFAGKDKRRASINKGGS